MPDYENLGFQVNVDGADSTVSHLDNIIKRLEKYENATISVQKASLSLKNAQISLVQSQQSLANVERNLAEAKKVQEKASNTRVLQEEKLNAILNNKKSTQLQILTAQTNYTNALLSEQIASSKVSTQETNLAKARENVERNTNNVVKAELSLQQAMKNSGKQQQKNIKALTAYFAKLTSLVVIARKVADFISGAIKASSEYIENLNLFAVSFGETYQQQLDWATNLAKSYGLASNEVVKFAGTFRELASSLGLVSDTADTVTKTVTNLGYDLSALFNTSVENAMEKLQSGIFSGNVRPLRAYGIDISQQQINALFETNEALKQLGVNAQNLSQSDKVIARLIIALQSGKDSFGTMAREINNLQSQFRIFQGSLENLKMALGDVFEDVVQGFMQYVNAFIIALEKIVRAFKPLQVEDETPKVITNIETSTEDANEELDTLSNKLAGFDKFNVLQQGDEGGSNLAITEALNQLLQEQASIYDNELSAALDNMTNKANDLADAFINALGGLTQIKEMFGEAFGAVGQALKNDTPQLVKVLNAVLPSVLQLVVMFTSLASNILPIIVNIIERIAPLIGSMFDSWSSSFYVITEYLPTISFIIEEILDLLDAFAPVFYIIEFLSKGVSGILIGLKPIINGIIGVLTALVEFIKRPIEALEVLGNAIANWDFTNLGEKLGAIWSKESWEGSEWIKFFNKAEKADFAFLKSWKHLYGFADGGYSNANLIMTHENGKREWVGKAAGSSAIVNDTQMSDIMEGAVAKGVFSAMRANSAMTTSTPSNEYTIIKIGEEEVFRAVRRTANKQGKDFATV